MPVFQSIVDLSVTQVSVQTQVTKLARLHGPMVFATAYRILGSPQLAEDVQQDVFLKLLKRRNDDFWDQVDNWPGLLRVMTQNRALDVLRREQRRHRNPIDSASAPSPETDLLRLQRAEQLRRALARLSKKDALIFSLRHIEQLSYKEIATQLGVTQNKIGVALHRINKKLRKLLRINTGTNHD